MKRKLLYVFTVLAMLGLSLPMAMPSAAAPGNMQWLAQPLPSSTGHVLWNGSDVTDIAVGTGAIYAVDNTTGSGIAYRSTDGGQSFTALTVVSGAGRLKKISVAPDNANALGVTDGTTVFTSTDAGSTWSSLPALPALHTGAIITDLAVAPARAGTLLGREYVIAVADPTSGVVTRGDVLIIGGNASWTSVGPTGTGEITSQRDYVAVAVTPNFVGDRSVVALGAAATPGTTGANGVVVQVINTATLTVISTANLYSGSIATTTDFGNETSGIFAGSISLPTDFDATTSSGRRAYAGFASFPTASGQGDNDVYRVDDTSSRALGALTSQGVWSVSYAGTVTGGGTLLEGRSNTAEIKYTTDMTSNSPTWTTTKKLMPTAVTNVVVMVANDFATSKMVYCGTTGTESALSVSVDGGISFDQASLIDIVSSVTNSVYKAIGLAITPDGKTAFLLTSSSASGALNISLWKSPTPIGATTWKRIGIWAQAAATNPSVAFFTLSPDYATTSTMYVFDLVNSGSIYRSSDGGATWWNRMLPTGIGLRTFAFQDADTGYIADNVSSNIYKTTDGGFNWSTAVSPNAGRVTSLLIGKTDQLFVGGAGYMSVSNDGGSTFTQIVLNSGENYRLAKDKDYATNNTIYLADVSGTTGKVYRLAIGTDPTPLDLLAPNPSMMGAIGISVRAGVLYVARATMVERATNPLDTPGTIFWRSMDTPTLTGMAQMVVSRDASANTNVVYMRNTTGIPQLYAYSDYLANAKPAITSPGDNTTLPIDPVTGRGEQFNLVLNAMGTGTGLVTHFDVQITEKAVGWGGATMTPNIYVVSPLSPVIASTAFVPPGGLLANREYLIRARAANEVSNDNINSLWSDPLTISTFPPAAVAPTVATENATDVTSTSATLRGTLIDRGTASLVDVSFEWGTTPGSYTTASVPVAMNTPGPFSYSPVGLLPGTPYYFRAKADGGTAGTSYGVERSFVTPATAPAGGVGGGGGGGVWPAEAISNLRLSLSSNAPSSTNVTYRMYFTTARALTIAAGDTVTVVFPNGTDLSNVTASKVWVGSSGVPTPPCSTIAKSGTTLVATLLNNIPAGEAFIRVDGVTNPVAGTYTLTVNTSRETEPVVSRTYRLPGYIVISPVSLSNNRTQATGVNYTFTVQVDSGLSEGRWLEVIFPAGTDLGSVTPGDCSLPYTGTTNPTVINSSERTVTFFVDAGAALQGGVAYQISIGNVTNSGTVGAQTLLLWTNTGCTGSQTFSLVGSIIFVRTGGNDSNDGLSWANAKKTINAAIAVATDGSGICVGEGTYTENVTVNKPVTISGNYPADGGSPTKTRATVQTSPDTAPVFDVTANGVTIEFFTITGASGNGGNGILLNGASGCRISECNITGNYYGIMMTSSALKNWVAGCDINNNAIGIYAATGGGNGVNYSNITGNTEYGVWAGDSKGFGANMNWWGSPSGPGGPRLDQRGNPTGLLPGSGDRVTQGVWCSPWYTRGRGVVKQDAVAYFGGGIPLGRGWNVVGIPVALDGNVREGNSGATYTMNRWGGLWDFGLRESHYSGNHTGPNNAAALTDTGQSFKADNALAGLTIFNLTDGSSGTVTANTATTVTASLSGGVENDWDTNDVYQIGDRYALNLHYTYDAGSGTKVWTPIYYWDAGSKLWVQATADTEAKAMDAFYVRMMDRDTVPMLISPDTSVPSRYMPAGWNLVGIAYLPTGGQSNGLTIEAALKTVERVSSAAGDVKGYAQVVSPPVNQYSWIYIPPTGGGAGGTFITPENLDNSKAAQVCVMEAGRGYWVFMSNPGTMAGLSFTPMSFTPQY